ncbi:MAG: tetratricopeptide repeat protein [Candidatus Riflemargulisbacteria bacterium]
MSCKKESDITNKSKVLLILQKINNLNGNEKTLDSLYQKLLENRNDSINRNLLFQIGNVYYYNKGLDKYQKIIKQINRLALIANDSIQIAKSLQYLGDYYDEKNQLDSAFSCYNKSEKLYFLINDTINHSKLKLKKAGILYDNGNYNESEIELVKALKLLNKKNAYRLTFTCYNIIGLDLIELKNYSKSLYYLDLALNQLNKLDRSIDNDITFCRSTCQNNIGNAYLKMENYRKAQEFYEKAISIKGLNKSNPVLYAMILSNLAYSKIKKGDPITAKKMLFESYKIRDSIKSDAGIISSKFYIGEYYLSQKDTIKAIESITYCYNLSKKVKSSSDVLNSLKLLTEIDVKNKVFYAKEYFRVNDSLQLAERATRNKFARIEFETDKVVNENSILIKKETYIIIGSMTILFIIGTFFILYRLKTKNKELKYIQDQQVKNEEIYQLLLKQQSISENSRKEERSRIAMELHDGVVNSVFTSRFNLMQLQSDQNDKKAELIKELEKTESEIRRVSHELKTNLNFNDDSIINMISNLVESQKNEWNTQFVLTIDKFIDWSKISVEAKMNSYRIIQEVLQNVNKYSKAKRCMVVLLKTGSKTTIKISDNGVGFNTQKYKKGIGLNNIKERVKAIQGTLYIKSNPTKGTTIEIVF